MLHAPCKEAVAQPARPLTRGAVHIEIHRVRGEGLHRCVKQLAKRLVPVRGARVDEPRGEGDLEHLQPAHGQRAAHRDESQGAHRIRLTGVDVVFSALHLVVKNIRAVEAEGVERPVLTEKFVPKDIQLASAGRFHGEIQNARVIAAQVYIGVAVRHKLDRLRRAAEEGGGAGEIHPPYLAVGMYLQLLLREAVQNALGRHRDGAVAPIFVLVGVRHRALGDLALRQHHGVISVGLGTHEEILVLLCRKGNGRAALAVFIGKCAVREAVMLDKRALVGIALHARDTLAYRVGGKAALTRRRVGDHAVAVGQLRAQERGLAQMRKGACVIARHADGERGVSVGQIFGQRQLVHAVIAVRAARGAVGDKLAVDAHGERARARKRKHGALQVGREL